MSRVFVVQDVRWVNPRTGNHEPKYDTSPAEKFGELIYLLDHTIKSYIPQLVAGAITRVKEMLDDLSHQDYLLLLGDPTLIGICLVLASDRLDGRVKVLQWDRRRLAYSEISLDLRSERREWARVWT